jgi:hypothetical protein
MTTPKVIVDPFAGDFLTGRYDTYRRICGGRIRLLRRDMAFARLPSARMWRGTPSASFANAVARQVGSELRAVFKVIDVMQRANDGVCSRSA